METVEKRRVQKTVKKRSGRITEKVETMFDHNPTETVMDYIDLKNKTIFDFTRDKKILKEVLLETIYTDYIENPEEIVEESKDWTEQAKVSDIVEFSKITHNDELYSILEKEFKEKYPISFWKPGEWWPN